jgi:hypothetical protein
VYRVARAEEPGSQAFQWVQFTKGRLSRVSTRGWPVFLSTVLPASIVQAEIVTDKQVSPLHFWPTEGLAFRQQVPRAFCETTDGLI